MLNQKGFAPLLFVICIILLSGIIGGIYYFSNSSESTQKPNVEVIRIQDTPLTPIPSVTTQTERLAPFASSSASSSAQVIVNIPEGWKKENIVIESHSGIRVTSPDYKMILGYDWPGLVISISKQDNQQPPPTYEQRYQELHDTLNETDTGEAAYKDLEKTSIAGYEALSYSYVFEGHGNYYELWNGDDIWLVAASSTNGEPQIKYKDEINSILNSIKLP